MQLSHARAMFTIAAAFNIIAVFLLHPATGIAAMLDLQPLIGYGAFEQIALLAIGGFGVGYWIVSRNPEQNRGLVVLGMLLKVGVTAIIVGHYLAGDANLRMLLLVSGDALFALAFLHFLRSRAAAAAARH